MAKTILVVDDDRTNIRILQSRLEKEGFYVSTALNGKLGLQRVQCNPPHLIVLDIEMPEMNGYSFLLELQKMEDCRRIPVIIQTAHPELKPIFDLNKVKAYITKPLNINDLIQRIKDCLAEENS